MPIIAEISFWVWPDIYDVIGAFGLIAGLLGIWIALRDIKNRVTKAENAARDAVARVGRLILGKGVAEAIHFLREAREACRQRWLRAIIFVEETRHRIANLQDDQVLVGDDRIKLVEGVDDLSVLIRHLEKKKADDELSDVKKKQLDDLGSLLMRVEGRIRSAELEITNVG